MVGDSSVLSVVELRNIARRSIKASRDAPDPSARLLLAEIAFEASQLAQVLEANGLLTRAEADFHARLLEKINKSEFFLRKGAEGGLLDNLLNGAMDVMSADMGNIQLLDADKNTLRIVVHRGFEAPFLAFFSAVDGLDNSACAFALYTAQRIVVSDIAASPFFVGKRSGDVMREAGVRAVQSTPLVGSNGKLKGMLSTHWRAPCKPGAYAFSRLDSLIGNSRDAFDGA